MKHAFDDIDQQILRQLRLNGRTTLAKLATECRRTSMAVRKRLMRFLNRNLLHISASLNMKQLKIHPLFLRLEVESGAAKAAILSRFQNCPRVIQIFSTLGSHNLVVLMFAENHETLESEQEQICAIRSSDGIRRSEVVLITDIAYDTYLPLRIELASHDKEKAPCGADCANCRRYIQNLCLACPATIHYKGPL